MKRPRARKWTSARAPADAGFLVAETLITFALSALVLVGLVSAAAVLMRTNDRSVAMVGASDDLARGLSSLRRDLAALKRARWSGDEPQPFVFRGGPNSLFFVADAPAADGGRERRVVSLREVERGGGTALMRAEAPLAVTAAGWSELRFGRPAAVPTGPARLRFRYLAEPAPGAPAPPAVDGWPSGTTLPAAVVVEAVDAATRRLIVAERIAVRADADVGCADRTRKPPGAQPGSGAQQRLAAQPGRPPDAAVPFSLETQGDSANPNEFCGRADKGVAPRPSVAGGLR